MPLVENSISAIPTSAHATVAELFFEHTWLGYQQTSHGPVIYRLPTLKECLQYHKAAQFSPVRACRLFFDKIIVWNAAVIAKLGIDEIGKLMTALLLECFPQDETKVFDEIDESTEMYLGNLAHIMETYVAAIGDTDGIWDLNIVEASQKVGLAQVITSQRIRGNEQKNKRARRQQPRAAQSASRQTEARREDAEVDRGM